MEQCFFLGTEEHERIGPKAAKDTSEEVTSDSREGQINGNADKV